MKKNLFLLGFVLSLAGFACQEVIDPNQLNFDEAPNQLVVEGWIYDTTNRYSQSYVSFSYSYFIGDDGLPPAVDEGLLDSVRITEVETGITVNLVKVASDPYRWIPDPANSDWNPSAGKGGERSTTYRLDFLYKGLPYYAIDQMNPVPRMDALSYEFKDEDDPTIFNEEDVGYYFIFNGREPCTLGDNYRFKAYKGTPEQEVLQFNRPEDLIVIADEGPPNVNGNYISLEFPTLPYDVGDTAYFEMLTISDDALNFYIEAQEQINNGGLFATPPFDVRTNVVSPPGGEEAIGFFGTAEIESYFLVIRQDLRQDYAGLIGGRAGKLWIIPPTGDLEDLNPTFIFNPDGSIEAKDIPAGGTICLEDARNAQTVFTGTWSVNEDGSIVNLSLPLLGISQDFYPIRNDEGLPGISGVAMSLSDSPSSEEVALGFIVPAEFD